ncbi:ATP-dependent Clp protease proteolytic subunit-related protein 4, chloroplastic, partial [Mucuna pruriens]
MEFATTASSLALNKPMLALPSSSRTITPIRALNSSTSSVRTSLSTNFVASYAGISSASSLFSGHKLRPSSLNPASFRGSNAKRGVVTMVIPFSRGSAWEQPPPDLASYLYKNRIVYLGMSLVPSVTELLLAEFLYLQYEDDDKPIYLYINSTGTTKGGEKLGYETEAFAIYDVMRYVKPPIFTLCVGNAWGEAALLLAAGAKGNRSALPSSTIMIRQPIARFQGQATDVNLARREVNNVKTELVKLYAKHIEKSPEQIEADIQRPKYFSPSEAVEYGIIDKVLYNDRGTEDRGNMLKWKIEKINSQTVQPCRASSGHWSLI